jgi:hypothetical protein
MTYGAIVALAISVSLTHYVQRSIAVIDLVSLL